MTSVTSVTKSRKRFLPTCRRKGFARTGTAKNSRNLRLRGGRARAAAPGSHGGPRPGSSESNRTTATIDADVAAMDPASQLYKSLATEERSFEDDPGAIFLGSCGVPCDCIYPLPVEEKAISEPSGNA